MMTSKKTIQAAVVAATAALSAGATPAYDGAGTDYSSLVTQKWTEDSANELMSVVNSFACIIANTRGDLAEHVNGSWSALIDEVACELTDELTDSDGTKYVVKTGEAGLFFLSADSSNCSDIAFTDISDIGLALADVPDLSDDTNYPRPSQAWADTPTPDDTACDVVHGVATCP